MDASMTGTVVVVCVPVDVLWKNTLVSESVLVDEDGVRIWKTLPWTVLVRTTDNDWTVTVTPADPLFPILMSEDVVAPVTLTVADVLSPAMVTPVPVSLTCAAASATLDPDESWMVFPVFVSTAATAADSVLQGRSLHPQ